MLRWPLAIGKKLLGVVPVAIDGFFRHHCTQHAAGIAYRILFSLAPLAIVLVSIAGLVLQDTELRDDTIDLIVDRLPFTESGAQRVEDGHEAPSAVEELTRGTAELAAGRG